jgi:hypothetical protein
MDHMRQAANISDIFGNNFTSILAYYGHEDTFWGHRQIFVKHIYRQCLKLGHGNPNLVDDCTTWLHLLDYFLKHCSKKIKLGEKDHIQEEIFGAIQQCCLVGGAIAENLILFCYEKLVTGGSGKPDHWLGYASYLQATGKSLASVLKLIKRCFLFFKGDKKPVISFYLNLKRRVLDNIDPKDEEVGEVLDQSAKIEAEIFKIQQKEALVTPTASLILPCELPSSPVLQAPAPHSDGLVPPKSPSTPTKVITVHLRDLPAVTDYADIEALVFSPANAFRPLHQPASPRP